MRRKGAAAAGGQAALWRSTDLRQEQHDKKRRLILVTAARIFAERGFHNTTIDHIAAALEVTKPTIYYYIESKEDILFQITSEALAELDQELQDGGETGLPAIERLQRFFRVYGRFMLTDLGICMAVVSDRSLNPESRRKLRLLKKEFQTRVRRIVEDGTRDGTIVTDDPRMFSFALFGAINWAPQWYAANGAQEPDAIVAAILAIFAKAATNPGAVVPRPRARSAARR
ncbi:TetR/AcrR family transcriptional regulator [Phreatobacter sp. AB_2022a]|uniref:TetR/AcrR family transcriptional regulator n=1 Tax=Phreatobacter sp. AB_2022a TaxID=3003134 RepID=UPI0022872408|nr:TetR/AcrR family transcriptional regulator [Phreatobacter sp. AB_2022a]MCZ0732804.1 TetR/AcrR family transcriptional regulator [Phreatobacter sp. AB_2022a]